MKKKKSKKYPSLQASMKDATYSNSSQEEVLKLLEEAFLSIPEGYNQPQNKAPRREFIVYSGCRTHGMIQLGKQWCNDPECSTCVNFLKALHEEAKK